MLLTMLKVLKLMYLGWGPNLESYHFLFFKDQVITAKHFAI